MNNKLSIHKSNMTDKNNNIKNRFKKFFTRKGMGVVALSILISGSLVYSAFNLFIKPNSDYKRAKYVLETTMNLDSVRDFTGIMKKVKPQLTDEMFKHYGLNDINFTYYNYFKLRGDTTRVEEIDHIKGLNGGTIIFKIHNNNINLNRRFLMLYKVDGYKLSYVHYVEILGDM